MSIIRFMAQNFKRLEVAEIEPDEHLNIISGKNAAGKSSVLEAIMYAFAGPTREIPKPIRDGENKARIVIETDEYTITRVITPSGQKLTVTTRQGSEVSSPQKFLDKLFNTVAIDPVRFTLLDAKDQVRTLIRATGLEEQLEILENQRQNAFNERTLQNRVVKEKEALKKQFRDEYPEGDLVSAADVTRELQEAYDHNRGIEEKRARLSKIGEEGTAVKNRLNLVTAEIKKLMEEQESLQLQLGSLRGDYEVTASEVSEATPVDTDEIQAKLANLEQRNSLIREREQRDHNEALLTEARTNSELLTEVIETIDKRKLELLQTSSIGIPLEIRDDQLYFKGNPLKQCSSAEQIKVSAAIAMRLQPKVKVIIIREGSLLDESSLKALSAIAIKHGYQLWVERVDDSGEVGIVIEEGKVKE